MNLTQRAPGRCGVRRSRGLTATLYSLAVLLLAACGATSQSPERDEPLSAGVSEPDYLVTLMLEGRNDLQAVERETGGRVLIWHPGEFAVVGLEQESVTGQGSASMVQLQSAGEFEANEESFLAGASAWMSGTSKVWGGGTSKVWGGGTSKVWGGGDSGLWVDGEYGWMPENSDTWRQIGLEEGQRLAPNLGLGVKVAIVDTGLDPKHPALSEALAPPEEWWDFHGDDSMPDEEGVLGEGGYGHGSNVAGIVRQIAPRATILPLRVLGPDGGGTVADVAAAIDWAADRGADVINISLGSVGTSAAVEAAIRSATDRGALVVASTGNTGDTNVTYPAVSSGSQELGWQRLSVTSVDDEDNKSSFATYGEEVELAAPGENVYGPVPDERMAAWSGTSMAAPMAAGALALALGEPSKVPASDLADELRHRAYHDIYNNRNREYQHLLGRGRIDLVEFLRNVVDR